MKPFQNVTSTFCPIPLKDIDTDMIIPAQYLTSISREGFGEHLFTRLKANDKNFPLNNPRFKGAEILVADSNFGCGSSREHAVWAILGAGFKVVIAKSFADIFTNNSAKNGLLLIQLPEATVEYLLREGQSRDIQLNVNLAEQTVTEITLGSPQQSWSFEYDTFVKFCLLNGLNDLEYLRRQAEAIRERRELLDKNFYFDTLQPNRVNSPSPSGEKV